LDGCKATFDLADLLVLILIQSADVQRGLYFKSTLKLFDGEGDCIKKE
jgi:hypothetical protein